MSHIVALSGGKDSTAMALWLAENEPRDYVYSQFSSSSVERKRLTAEAAEIPYDLATHIARIFKPQL